MSLTEYELQMMHVIWRAGEPITGTEILRRAEDKEWKTTSLHPMLNRLLSKGFIREEGFIREGRAFARTFLPIISCEQYYTDYLQNAARDAGVPALFSALMHSDALDEDALSQMRRMLDEKKND